MRNNKISQILDALFYKDISNLVYDYSYHNLNSSINYCWKMLHEKYTQTNKFLEIRGIIAHNSPERKLIRVCSFYTKKRFTDILTPFFKDDKNGIFMNSYIKGNILIVFMFSTKFNYTVTHKIEL